MSSDCSGHQSSPIAALTYVEKSDTDPIFSSHCTHHIKFEVAVSNSRVLRGDFLETHSFEIFLEWNFMVEHMLPQ